MAFLCIICPILFNEYFGEFVMTCIDIGEIGCMGIPKCLWMVIVVHLVKQTFLHDAACWCGFVYAWSVLGIPTSSSDNRRYASCMLATRYWKCSTGISAHLSIRVWQSSPRSWGRLSILVIAWPNSSKICSMVLQSGDLAGCSILVTLPCWRKSRITRAWWGMALSSCQR